MSLIAQRPSANALTFTRRARRPRSQGGEFDEEFGDGAWGVKLTEGLTSALQFAQKAFVDLAEYLFVFAAVEVDLVEFVDYLTQVDARFHVVVVIGEDFAHEQGRLLPLERSILARIGKSF